MRAKRPSTSDATPDTTPLESGYGLGMGLVVGTAAVGVPAAKS
jgi:hypothetical protein